MMVLSMVFVYFLVPETKSIPLENMDRLFEIRPVRKANKIVIEEVRLSEEDFRHMVEDGDAGNVKGKVGSVVDVDGVERV